MNIKKFVFKFINHGNKKIHIFEFDVHSTQIHEWKQKEDDIEGYVRWLSQHTRWEKVLKKEIKKLVEEKIISTGETFKDYVLSCEKTERKSKNINTNKNPGNEMHFIQIFHVEKCILQYVKGINSVASKEIDKISQIVQYKKYHEITHLSVEDNDNNNLVIRQILCTQGSKIIIQHEQKPSESKNINTNTQSSNPNLQQNALQSNVTKTTINNQFGGNNNDYELYKKYKKKYLDLKKNNY